MAMADWIAKYPGVQRLLDRGEEELLSPSVLPSTPLWTPYWFEGQTPVPVEPSAVRAWMRWYEAADVTVMRTPCVTVDGRAAVVSTVFLGHNLQMVRGAPPLLFETIIFGVEDDAVRERYSTWEDAVAGHVSWCTVARAWED